MDLNIHGLDHVVLRVSDLDRAIDFYAGVLGCPVERRVPDLGLVQLRAGTGLIDLVDVAGRLGREGGAAPGTQGRNLDHFCLRLERFDEAALRAYLQDNGVSLGESGRRYGADGFGPSLYIEDPDGNRVELKGPASDV